MGKKLSLLIQAVLILLPGCLAAAAQEKYKVEIKNDSKIIHVDELGLPVTVSVSEVLRMLPEILNRPGVTAVDNYDIQLDGFSVGDSKEQFLSQTYLADVEKIEVSENPASSYQNNGQGGSINFTLRKLDEESRGKVNLDAYSLFQLQPTVQFNFRRKKYTAYSWLAYDMYRPGEDYETLMKTNPSWTASSDTTAQKRDYQMLRLYLDYRPSEKDDLSLQLFQTYSRNDYDYTHLTEGSMVIENSTKNLKSFSLSGNLKYTHDFKSSKFNAQLRYEHKPSHNGMTFGSNRFYDVNNLSDAISGKVGYQYNFVPFSEVSSGMLDAGVNYNITRSENSRYEEFNPGFHGTHIINDVDMSAVERFVSPYIRTEWVVGQWRFNALVEYQMYDHSIKEVEGEDFSKAQNDFTGKLIAGWQLAPHHHLRFLVNRSVRRPTYDKIYPYPLYDVTKRYYFKGNPELEPERLHEVGLDYITDHSSDQGDFFMANANFSYIHVDGIFGTTEAQVVTDSYYPFKSFCNNGENDVLKVSAMLLYSVGRLSVSFSGNVFSNNTLVNKVRDQYTYYSLSILPSMRFRNNWSMTASAMYCSPVKTNYTELGQSSFVHLRVSKGWQDVIVSIHGMLPLSAMSTDLYLDEEGTFSIRRYMPYKPYLGISCSWQI